MRAILLLVAACLAFFNLFGGLVAAVWLAILGEWRLIGAGILYMLFGTFLISVALIPGMILGAPALLAQQRQMCIRDSG